MVINFLVTGELFKCQLIWLHLFFLEQWAKRMCATLTKVILYKILNVETI